MKDRLVNFFDPHPGLMGCPRPLPELLKNLAAELNGQTKSLKKTAAETKNVLNASLQPGETGKVRLCNIEGNEFIAIEINRLSGLEDGWRLIRFK